MGKKAQEILKAKNKTSKKSKIKIVGGGISPSTDLKNLTMSDVKGWNKPDTDYVSPAEKTVKLSGAFAPLTKLKDTTKKIADQIADDIKPKSAEKANPQKQGEVVESSKIAAEAAAKAAKEGAEGFAKRLIPEQKKPAKGANAEAMTQSEITAWLNKYNDQTSKTNNVGVGLMNPDVPDDQLAEDYEASVRRETDRKKSIAPTFVDGKIQLPSDESKEEFIIGVMNDKELTPRKRAVLLGKAGITFGDIDKHAVKYRDFTAVQQVREAAGVEKPKTITITSKKTGEPYTISEELYQRIIASKTDGYMPKFDVEYDTLLKNDIDVWHHYWTQRYGSEGAKLIEKYHIDYENFSQNDLYVWADRHGYEVSKDHNGNVVYVKEKGKGPTDEEKSDYEKLQVLVENNNRRKSAGEDEGVWNAAQHGFRNAVTFGSWDKVADWASKKDYDEAGFISDSYVSPSQANAKTLTEHPTADFVGNLAGDVVSFAALSEIGEMFLAKIPKYAKLAEAAARGVKTAKRAKNAIDTAVVVGTHTSATSAIGQDWSNDPWYINVGKIAVDVGVAELGAYLGGKVSNVVTGKLTTALKRLGLSENATRALSSAGGAFSFAGTMTGAGEAKNAISAAIAGQEYKPNFAAIVTNILSLTLYAGLKSYFGSKASTSAAETEPPFEFFTEEDMSDPAALKKKYRNLSKEYHPDAVRGRGGSAEEISAAEKKTAALNAEYARAKNKIANRIIKDFEEAKTPENVKPEDQKNAVSLLNDIYSDVETPPTGAAPVAQPVTAAEPSAPTSDSDFVGRHVTQYGRELVVASVDGDQAVLQDPHSSTSISIPTSELRRAFSPEGSLSGIKPVKTSAVPTTAASSASGATEVSDAVTSAGTVTRFAAPGASNELKRLENKIIYIDIPDSEREKTVRAAAVLEQKGADINKIAKASTDNARAAVEAVLAKYGRTADTDDLGRILSTSMEFAASDSVRVTPEYVMRYAETYISVANKNGAGFSFSPKQLADDVIGGSVATNAEAIDDIKGILSQAVSNDVRVHNGIYGASTELNEQAAAVARGDYSFLRTAEKGAPAVSENTTQAAETETARTPVTLYPVGDFYEAYGDDAKAVAQTAGLHISSKVIRGKRTPMAGFPKSALSTYAPRIGSYTIADMDTMADEIVESGFNDDRLINMDAVRNMSDDDLGAINDIFSGRATNVRPNTPASNSMDSARKNDETFPHVYDEDTADEGFLNAVDKNMLPFIDKAMADISDNSSTYTVGKTTNKLNREVQRLTGVDTALFNNRVKINYIRHIVNEHGANGTTDHSMANNEDIARMGYVIRNFDNIELLKTTSKEFRDKKQNPAPMVRLSKRVDGTYYVVEAVPDTKAKSLQVISAYINKASTRQTEDAYAPSGNVRNASADIEASDIIVSEDNAVVKGKKDLTAETGKPFVATLYHGAGKSKSEIYGTGTQIPLAGEGRYYAFTEKDARNYGDNISREKVSLNNPLVIRDDAEWSALINAAGWDYSLPVHQSKDRAASMINSLKNTILSKGHDGLIIQYKADKYGDLNERTHHWCRTIDRGFGHDTVVVYPEAEITPLSGAEETVSTSEPLALTDKCELFETTHTKTGEALWVIRVEDKLSKDDYTELKTKVKAVGGYYSPYTKRPDGKSAPGFVFKTEPDNAVIKAFNDFFGKNKGAETETAGTPPETEKTTPAREDTAEAETVAETGTKGAKDAVTKKPTIKRAKKADWSAHDTYWYAPNSKTVIAYSTRATSDYIELLADDNPNATIAKLKDLVTYDPDAEKVLQAYIDSGFGDEIARDHFSRNAYYERRDAAKIAAEKSNSDLNTAEDRVTIEENAERSNSDDKNSEGLAGESVSGDRGLRAETVRGEVENGAETDSKRDRKSGVQDVHDGDGWSGPDRHDAGDDSEGVRRGDAAVSVEDDGSGGVSGGRGRGIQRRGSAGVHGNDGLSDDGRGVSGVSDERGDRRGLTDAEAEPEKIKTGDAEIAEKAKKNPSNKNNFVITDEVAQEIDNGKPSAKDNINAIELLLKLESEGRAATDEEKRVLAKYKGWGGVDLRRLNWSDRQKLYNYFDDGQLRAMESSSLSAFFTPTKIIDGIYAGLRRMGFKGGNVLESSMGVGNFFGRMPKAMVSKSALMGVEMESYTARIAQYLYPGATVINKPFQDVAIKNSSFDLVIGNVPFANIKLTYDKKKYSLHNYFIISSLDKLKPGGVLAVITSAGTLDNYDPSARKAMMDRADVVACYKLPAGVFSRNAATDVQTDLIIMCKRETGTEQRGESILNVVTNKDGLRINEYFEKHPENVLGVLEKGTNAWGEITTVTDDGSFDARFEKAMGKLPKDLFSGKTELARAETLVSVSTKPNIFEKDGKVFVDDGMGEATEAPKAQAETMRGYIAVRDAYKAMLDAYARDLPESEIKPYRDALAKAYDSFVKKHGAITGDGKKKVGGKKCKNNTFLSTDSDYYLVGGLERYDKDAKKFVKSTLFDKDTLRRKRVDHVDTASDALAVSLNETGKVDFKRMTELTGKTEKQLAQELEGDIVYTPEGSYELTDIYLSGNIYDKLEKVKGKQGFEKQQAMLEAVLPTPRGAAEITPKLGANYISADYIQDFAHEVLGELVKITKDRSGAWTIEGANRGRYGERINVKYGGGGMNGIQLLQKILNDANIAVNKTVDKKPVFDAEATEVAKQKAEDIKQAFADWIFLDADRRSDIVSAYNRTYNNHRPIDYTRIAENLSLSSMNNALREKLYPHQRKGIARFLFGGDTLFAHGVGTGKTFAMIASVMEAKNMGLINKAAMVVPNNKVTDFRRDIAEAYPNARVLVIDTENKKRQSILGLVNSNDWDIVLVARTTFTKIPVSPEVEANFVNRTLEQYDNELEDLRASGQTKGRAYKGLITRRENMAAKLGDLNESIKRDTDGVYFDKLGIDCICVDEAHNYKSITTPTKLQIKGLVNGSDAQQANDMLMKLDYLRDMGGRVLFGTGTPITNTVSEIYNMTRLVRPDILEDAGIHSLDEWVNTFAQIDSETEIGIDNQVKTKATQTIRRFVNPTELVGMFRQFADVVFTQDVVKNLPKAVHKTITMKGTSVHQQVMAIMNRELQHASPREKFRKSSTLMTMASAAAADPRMLAGANSEYNEWKDFTPEELDFEESKTNAMCKTVLGEYEASKKNKGTQIIFSSAGAGSGKIYTFKLFDAIKEQLVEGGIPESEIVIVRDQSQAKLEELYDRVNAGEVRVLIGTYSKMAEGLNVQRRVVAIHHLAPTFKPSDWEQANARGVRAGNIHDEVRIYRYLQEDTFDAYKWQAQDRKGEMINNALRGEQVTELEDIGADEDSDAGVDVATAMAISSGNPLVKEKIDIDKEVTRLQTLRRNYMNEVYRYQDTIAKNPGLIRQAEAYKQRLEADIELKGRADEKPDIKIGGKKYDKQTDANKALTKAVEKAPKNGKFHKVGEYNGFDIMFSGELGGMGYSLIVKSSGEYKVEYAGGGGNNIARVAGVLNRLDGELERTNARIEQYKKDLDFAQVEVKKPFDHETELTAALEKQKDITYRFEHYGEKIVENSEGEENGEAYSMEESNEREDVSNGSGKRKDGNGTGVTAGRVDQRPRSYQKGRETANERRDEARAIKDAGHTVQKEYGRGLRRVRGEFVKPEAYNPRMRAIVDKNKARGLNTEIIIGNLDLANLPGKKARGMWDPETNTVIVRYDHPLFTPEQLDLHENYHAEAGTERGRKALNVIKNSLSLMDRQTALDKLSKDYSGIADKHPGLLMEELVANTLAGMNEYAETYQELINDYWGGNEIDESRYDPAQYAESTDAGGRKLTHIVENTGYSTSDNDIDDLFYPGNINFDEYDEKIDKWLKGELGSDEILQLGDTPLVMQELKVQNLPLIMQQDVLSKATGDEKDHNVYLDTIRDLPILINDPLVVMESKTVTGAYVLLTEDVDKSGRPVIVALHVDKRQNRLRINKIASVYGRNNFEAFISNEERDGRIKYVDDIKIQAWSTSRGLRLPKLVQSNPVNNNILYKSDIVNRFSKNNFDDPKFSVDTIDRDEAEYTPEKRAEMLNDFRNDNMAVKKKTVQESLIGASAHIKDMASRLARVFPEIPERGKEGTFYAEFRKNMVQWKALPQTASFKVQDTLRNMTKDLDPKDYEIFSQLVYYLDLQEEAEMQESRGVERVRLPHGYTHAQVNGIVADLQNEASDKVKSALKKRSRIWEELVNNYVASNQYIGFNTANRFNRKHYYRHQVIDYMNTRGIGGKRTEINDRRGWLKARKGSDLATNTDFLEVEYNAMLQMTHDMYVANLLGKTKQRYDIKPQLEQQARRLNQNAIKEIIKKEANGRMNAIGDLDSETFRQQQWYNRRIMTGFSNLMDLGSMGKLPELGGGYRNVIAALSSGSLRANGLYKYIGELAATEDIDEDVRIAAQTVLKFTNQKRQWVKALLGNGFNTWETLAKATEGYSIHQPRRGNYFYNKTIIDEDAFAQAFNTAITSIAAGDPGVFTPEGMKEMIEQYGETVRLIGAPYEQWVIPDKIIKTLDEVANPKESGAGSLIARSMLNAWKGWSTSVNPLRTFKFGLRNLVGDADAVIAGKPQVLKYTPRAVKEIYQAMVKKNYTPDMQEWIDRGGYTSMLFINEMDREAQEKLFKKLIDKTGKGVFEVLKVPKKLVSGYVDSVQNMHDFREAILRYSAYLYFKDSISKNGGAVKDYVASNRWIVQGLESNEDKAYQLSKDLLGAYDEVSRIGQNLRRYWIPFYSFTETNFKRYTRMFENIIRGDGNIGKKAAKVLLKALQVNLLTLLMIAWNKLVKKDDDDKLPPSVRNIPHITLGRIGDDVYAFRQLGSFTELLEWVGLDDYMWDQDDLLAPVDKLTGMITPAISGTASMLTGLNFYPSVRNPQVIRDKWSYLSNSFGVNGLFDIVTGKPNRGWGEVAKGAFVYSYDIEESAYNEIISHKYNWQGRDDGTIYGATDKSNALYYMKKAIKYKDEKTALKYLDKYFEAGGTGKGIESSLARLNPMYGFTGKDTKAKGEEWIASMTDDEKDKLRIAIAYYENDLSLPEDLAAQLRKKKDAITNEEAKNLLRNYIKAKCK